MQTFSVDNLPEGEWREFRKVAPTRMIRIEGPFAVQIHGQGPESVVTCDDGWVGLDARGYPYPIDVDEQALIYEAV